jgi:hypothetical protein
MNTETDSLVSLSAANKRTILRALDVARQHEPPNSPFWEELTDIICRFSEPVPKWEDMPWSRFRVGT